MGLSKKIITKIIADRILGLDLEKRQDKGLVARLVWQTILKVGGLNLHLDQNLNLECARGLNKDKILKKMKPLY